MAEWTVDSSVSPTVAATASLWVVLLAVVMVVKKDSKKVAMMGC